MTEERHPRVGDRVITFAETATIVDIDTCITLATIERDDDVRLTAPVERMRWLADRKAWVIVPEGVGRAMT